MKERKKEILHRLGLRELREHMTPPNPRGCATANNLTNHQRQPTDLLQQNDKEQESNTTAKFNKHSETVMYYIEPPESF